MSEVRASFADPRGPDTRKVRAPSSDLRRSRPAVDSDCHASAQSFIYVRPLNETERSMVAPDQVIPRLAMEYMIEDDTINVLDPAHKFRPKKGFSFAVENTTVFWNAKDPVAHDDVYESETQRERAIWAQPLHTNDELYDATVTRMIPAIRRGFDTAFLFFGGTAAGKTTTLLGSDSEQGILLRFASQLKSILSGPNSDIDRLSFSMEAVECTTMEQYIDAQADGTRRKSTPELKVREDPVDGVILTGATRFTEIEPEALCEQVLQVVRGQKRHRNNLVVAFRISQEFEFKGEDSVDGTGVNQTIRHTVVFALLRNFTASLKRCFEAAIERDTGGNPQSKVPTRDNAFARLFPEVFSGNMNIVSVHFASPHFQHVRDAVATLKFATRITQIKTCPKLREQESLRQLRKLQGEVRALKKTMETENSSLAVIQEELDKRQAELERCEKEYEEKQDILNDRQAHLDFRERRRKSTLKSNRVVKTQLQRELEAEERAVAQTEERAASVMALAQREQDAIKEQRDQIEVTVSQQRRVEECSHQLESRIASFKAMDDRIADVESTLDSSEKEIARAAEELVPLRQTLQTDTERHQEALQHFLKAEQRLAELQASVDAVQKRQRELEKEKQNVAHIEEKIAGYQKKKKELENKEEELKKAIEAKSCCSIA